MGLFDRRALSTDVRAGLQQHLADSGGRRPRVLAWASGPEVTVVALTDRLAVLGPDGWESLPWHEVQSAGWNDEGTRFTWATVAAPRTPRFVELTAPGRLPEVVRERVEQTFVVQHRVDLTPGRPAIVSGRRPAAGAGEVTWHLTPAPGVDLSDPELAETARRVLERVQNDWA